MLEFRDSSTAGGARSDPFCCCADATGGKGGAGEAGPGNAGVDTAAAGAGVCDSSCEG